MDISEQVLNERYYLRDKHGVVCETHKEWLMRVARGVNHVEKEGSTRDYWTDRCYWRLKNNDFMFNTPTLMNAEKKNGQLSACFVLPIEDSISDIFETLRHAALVHQTGGGTGFDFSRLRPEGSMVSNKSGVSTGPLAFCQVYDKTTEVIKQGASRRGANMMTLRVDHPDILDFINMKMKKGVMENFNVSVAITDEFMDALENNADYDLRHPYTGTVGTLRARSVWRLIAECAHRSAEPGIIFIDRINQESSFHEVIETVNPCGEQPLPPYGVCNLGSINLSNFVREGHGFDWERLEDMVYEGVRFLDNVVDANCYPLPEIDIQAKRYRNIGLGVMGWADALIKIGLPYDSEEAIMLGDQTMEAINVLAHQASVDLAEEKGSPIGAPFKSPFSYADPDRRNATLTTVAPTGTISMIAKCSSGIEPIFAFLMKRLQMDRMMVDYHPLMAEHRKQGKYNTEAFVEADEVSPENHIRMQAIFQKHVDSAISKTINLPKEATVEDVLNAYYLAYETGCKGTTVYRDGSRGEGVLSKLSLADLCCDQPNIKMQEGCETCYNCHMSKCAVA